MSQGTDQLREWASDDRAAAADLDDQIAAIRYLAAAGSDDANASQSSAQAAELEAAKATLDATADGWESIADTLDGQVDDPDRH